MSDHHQGIEPASISRAPSEDRVAGLCPQFLDVGGLFFVSVFTVDYFESGLLLELGGVGI